MQEGGLFRAGSFFIELTKGIIIFLIIVALIHFFIATVFKVEGKSMEPNFHQDQYMLINKLSYIAAKPIRGDVVILKFPGDPEKTKYIKRIIGLPGEKVAIKDGLIYINDKKLREIYIANDIITEPEMELTLASDEYFVVGDNRPNSSDSRIWGPAPKKFLIGKAIFYLFPFKDAGYIPKIYY